MVGLAGLRVLPLYKRSRKLNPPGRGKISYATTLLTMLVTDRRSAWSRVLQRPARADDVARHFDIPAQDMQSALNEFARQSDRQILFSTDVAASKRTAGVKGELEPEAALKQLLKGTGLTFRVTADRAILVENPNPSVRARPIRERSRVQDAREAPPAQDRSDARAGKIEEVFVTATRREAEPARGTAIRDSVDAAIAGTHSSRRLRGLCEVGSGVAAVDAVARHRASHIARPEQSELGLHDRYLRRQHAIRLQQRLGKRQPSHRRYQRVRFATNRGAARAAGHTVRCEHDGRPAEVRDQSAGPRAVCNAGSTQHRRRERRDGAVGQGHDQCAAERAARCATDRHTQRRSPASSTIRHAISKTRTRRFPPLCVPRCCSRPAMP